MIQQTLVVLKPDTIGRSIVGEVITRFERAGLRLAAIKMCKPDKDFLHHHYETISQMISRRGQTAFDHTLALMTKLPVVAMVWEGVEAIAFVRKLVGSTDPKVAPAGTIRGDYAHMSIDYANENNVGLPNLIHASGNLEEAQQEITHRFSKNELFEYDQTHKAFTR